MFFPQILCLYRVADGPYFAAWIFIDSKIHIVVIQGD